MLDFIQDGVTVYCLPDTAHCELTGENPLYMSDCPEGRENCCGYCPHYSEDAQRCPSDCAG